MRHTRKCQCGNVYSEGGNVREREIPGGERRGKFGGLIFYTQLVNFPFQIPVKWLEMEEMCLFVIDSIITVSARQNENPLERKPFSF